MKPKKSERDCEQLELGRPRLVDFLNMKMGLVQLADCIDWSKFERKFKTFFPSDRGRPALPVRLVVGLIYLKYVFDLSDEAVVDRLLSDPYWQYFCGFEYFQHKLSIDASSLTRWRHRIEEVGAEELLKETLSVAQKLGLLRGSEYKQVIVDTTVQSKNICYPVDSKLINKSREKLVKVAKEEGVKLRQSYKFKGKEEMIKSARYFHARQYKRGQVSVKRQLKRALKRRTAIEPVIGHIKQEHRMGVNYLHGIEGDKINPILVASAFNMRKIMRSFFLFFFCWLKKQIQNYNFIKNQPAF